MGDTEPTGARHRLTSEVTGRDISFGSPELSHKVKAPCETCNNGWMSQLEFAVGPILTPMIRSGFPVNLTADAQSLIAAWATKTAMMCEYLGSPEHPRYFTADERRWLMEKHRPPDDVYVWICHCRPPHAVQGSNLHLAPTGAIGGDATAYLATHAIGQFAFQVFAYRRLVAETNYVRIRKGPWEKCLFPIWPKNDESLEWPPPLTLVERRWQLFCERFVGFAAPPPTS